MRDSTFDDINKMISDLADMKVQMLELEVEEYTGYEEDWIEFGLEASSVDYIIEKLRDKIEAYL